MAILVSPGVEVNVIDESVTGLGGPQGTIPLIVIATKENKILKGTLGTTDIEYAQGTLKENAEKLYLITSQRDLIETFGEPVFYSKQGTPLHGYELNRYGLLAAYSFLGVANQAFVIRADVNLESLLPSEFEPTNPALTGTYWFDINETSWGIFASNGNPVPATAWNSKTPFVLPTKSNTETTLVGNVPYASNSSVPGVAGNLVISNVSVSITASDTVAQIVQKVNNANIPNIKALALRYDLKTWFTLRNTASEDIILSGSTPALLAALGLTQPSQITRPSLSIGNVGDTAVMPFKIDNIYFEKLLPEGHFDQVDSEAVPFWFIIGTSEWKNATPTRVVGTTSSNYLLNPIISGDQLIISDNKGNTVTVTFGAADVSSLATVVAKINSDISSAGQSNRFGATINSANRIVISNKLGEDLSLNEGPSNTSNGVLGPLGLNSRKGNELYYAPHYQIPANSVVGDYWIKTTSANKGVNYVIKVYNRNTGIWSIYNAPFYINDDVALFNMGSGIQIGSVYVRYNLYGTISQPIASHLIRRYQGPIRVRLVGSKVPGVTSNALVPGDNFVIIAGQPNGTTQSAVITMTGNSLEDAIADINTAAIPGVTAYKEGGFIVIENITGFSLTITYYDPVTNTLVNSGNTDDPIESLGFEDGTEVSRWETLSYVASTTEPRTEAEPGRLWYNEKLFVDIMVNDGDQWRGYRNYYPNTDPNGPILAALPPETQSDGTPLEDNDLWIDTGDLENYPKIYRWFSSTNEWVLIDNTDQTTPFGIIFADARPNADGTKFGSKEPFTMVLSDYVDPDAPNPVVYPAGILLFNTRASTYNVKEWNPDYFAQYVGYRESPGVQYSVGNSSFAANTITKENKGRWVTISGNKNDGSPYMGRHAQRRVIVNAMERALVENQDIRSEAVFFNLISCPGYPELIEEMITLNTDQKETAFIIGDTPARLQPNGTDIAAWAQNKNNAPSTGDLGLAVRNPYVALYYPWGLTTNLDGQEVMVPPSHIALRTIAYSDTVSFPWFPPAGFTRGLVTNATSVGYLDRENRFIPVILNQGQRDVLYTNNINPISFIPNRGLVVFGQKTLNPVASALDRINVARLVVFLKYNFDLLAKPFLFELNDRQTRDQVRSVFERFLGSIVALRGIYDFVVVCDRTNNTPDRIDRNELWIDVAIQPAKAIEFIYIPIRIKNTDEDLIAQ